jgi:hypothetical protein
MKTEISTTEKTPIALKQMLCTSFSANKQGAIIFYDGKLWLVDHYNAELYEGGYFASPIYVNDNGQYEARPAGGNWCYKVNGAKETDTMPIDRLKQTYQSWIDHLNWTCKIIAGSMDIKNNADCKKEYKKLQNDIAYYEGLLKNCA